MATGAEPPQPKGIADPSRWNLDIAGKGAYVPSYGSGTGLLDAYCWGAGLGAEYYIAETIPLRLELDYFSVSDSAWDSSLFRFRGFYGLKFGFLSGLSLPLGIFEAKLLAGAGLTFSGYSSLSTATAYPSILGEFRFNFPFQISRLKLGAFLGLPVEYMFRGTARTISTGFQAGLQIQLPERAAK